MTVNQNALYIQKIYSLLVGFIVLQYFLNYVVSTTIARTAECIMFGAMVYYYIRCRTSMRPRMKYINTMLVLLISWGAFIVVRGNWNVGIKDTIFKIIGSRGVALYLLPFLFFLPYDVQSLKKILNIFFVSTILSFPLWVLNADHLIQAGQETSYNAEGIANYLPFLAAFLLMLTPFFRSRNNLIIKSVYVIYFVLMLLNARRNVCFSLLSYGLIAYYIYFHFINYKHISLTITTTLFSLITVLLIFNNIDTLSQGPFKFMNKRAKEDTRSGVEKLFLYDFSKSSVSDWVIGRGLDGTYYQETRDKDTGLLKTDRSGIETGYLDLILKGGIIYVLLILMILIPAIYYGLKSGKILGASCGLFLTTYLIDMYTTCPISIFSVRAILFWFCISMCYSKLRYIDVGTIRRIKKIKQRYFVHFHVF